MGGDAAGSGAPSLQSSHVDPDALVLAGRRLRPDADDLPSPRFADDVWDLRAGHHLPNVEANRLRIRFYVVDDPIWRLTAKEYVYARLTDATLAEGRLPAITTLMIEFNVLHALFAYLTEFYPGLRLADIEDDQILENFLTIRAVGVGARWKPQRRSGDAWSLMLLHRASDRLTADRLVHLPFRGRTAREIAGSRFYGENRTPRIPPEVLAPYLRGALFYVQVAANDIRAAEKERQQLAESA